MYTVPTSWRINSSLAIGSYRPRRPQACELGFLLHASNTALLHTNELGFFWQAQITEFLFVLQTNLHAFDLGFWHTVFTAEVQACELGSLLHTSNTAYLHNLELRFFWHTASTAKVQAGELGLLLHTSKASLHHFELIFFWLRFFWHAAFTAQVQAGELGLKLHALNIAFPHSDELGFWQAQITELGFLLQKNIHINELGLLKHVSILGLAFKHNAVQINKNFFITSPFFVFI